MDRRNPLAVTRSYDWRKVANHNLSLLFSQQDKSNKIEISAKTTQGNLSVSLTYGAIPLGVTMNIPSNPAVQQTSGNDQEGLHIETTLDGRPDDASFALPLHDGFAINVYRPGTVKIPTAIINTASTRNIPHEDAIKFTEIIRQNKTNELLELISVVRPALKELQLLQDKQVTTLYARLEDGNLILISMLGDGLQTVLSIAISIMNVPGGILLLDEFDSTIHYSILSDVWAMIAKLANKYNCQIFAVTHSRECIKAATEGIDKGSRIEDLRYIRLENNQDKIEAVCYSGQEIVESLASDWEVR